MQKIGEIMYKVCDSLIEKAQKKEKSNRNFNLFLAILVLLMVTFFVFTNYIFISVYVDGDSMCPTLSDGNVLFANKNITPEEGDIIVIDGEKEKLDGSGYDWLIKRAIVIGQKDKTIIVEIRDNSVWVGEEGQELKVLVEDYLPQGTETTPMPPDFGCRWEITEGEIFYLGDNRADSKDSRSEYGTCSVEQVVGVVPEWALSVRGISRFLFDVGQFFANLF